MTVSVLRFYCQLIIVGPLQEACELTTEGKVGRTMGSRFRVGGPRGRGVKFGTDTQKNRETKTKTQKVTKIRMEFRVIYCKLCVDLILI